RHYGQRQGEGSPRADGEDGREHEAGDGRDRERGKESRPTAKIDTTPAAQGEVGEMERFGRTFMSRMAEQRNDYLKQLDAIGWDKILDMQRIAGDKSLSQSKAMVGKARSLVASYREKALATIEGARADIDKLQVSDAAKAGFRKGFEKS